MDPHSYRPNEFFANNWVYDGLVEYGRIDICRLLQLHGLLKILQMRGKSISSIDVKFHDGATWNCAAAKLNFDHAQSHHLLHQIGMVGGASISNQIVDLLSTYVFQIEEG